MLVGFTELEKKRRGRRKGVGFDEKPLLYVGMIYLGYSGNFSFLYIQLKICKYILLFSKL